MRKIAFLAIFALSACGFYPSAPDGDGSKPPVSPGGIEPKFSSIYQNVIKPKCLSCHSASNPMAGVNLSSYSATMSSQVVRVGDHSRSDLFIQVDSGNMPRGGSHLSDDAVSAIAAWIDAGALNN